MADWGSWSTGGMLLVAGRRPTDYTLAFQRVGPPRAGCDNTLSWAPSSPPFGTEEDAEDAEGAAPPKGATPAGTACIKDLIT